MVEARLHQIQWKNAFRDWGSLFYKRNEGGFLNEKLILFLDTAKSNLVMSLVNDFAGKCHFNSHVKLLLWFLAFGS